MANHNGQFANLIFLPYFVEVLSASFQLCLLFYHLLACLQGRMATTLSVNSKELALTAPGTILLVQKEPALGNVKHRSRASKN